jgi:hypothetical protein
MVKQRLRKEEQIGKRRHIVIFVCSGQIKEKGLQGACTIDQVVYQVCDVLYGFRK